MLRESPNLKLVSMNFGFENDRKESITKVKVVLFDGNQNLQNKDS